MADKLSPRTAAVLFGQPKKTVEPAQLAEPCNFEAHPILKKPGSDRPKRTVTWADDLPRAEHTDADDDDSQVEIYVRNGKITVMREYFPPHEELDMEDLDLPAETPTAETDTGDYKGKAPVRPVTLHLPRVEARVKPDNETAAHEDACDEAESPDNEETAKSTCNTETTDKDIHEPVVQKSAATKKPAKVHVRKVGSAKTLRRPEHVRKVLEREQSAQEESSKAATKPQSGTKNVAKKPQEETKATKKEHGGKTTVHPPLGHRRAQTEPAISTGPVLFGPIRHGLKRTLSISRTIPQLVPKEEPHKEEEQKPEYPILFKTVPSVEGAPPPPKPTSYGVCGFPIGVMPKFRREEEENRKFGPPTGSEETRLDDVEIVDGIGIMVPESEYRTIVGKWMEPKNTEVARRAEALMEVEESWETDLLDMPPRYQGPYLNEPGTRALDYARKMAAIGLYPPTRFSVPMHVYDHDPDVPEMLDRFNQRVVRGAAAKRTRRPIQVSTHKADWDAKWPPIIPADGQLGGRKSPGPIPPNAPPPPKPARLQKPDPFELNERAYQRKLMIREHQEAIRRERAKKNRTWLQYALSVFGEGDDVPAAGRLPPDDMEVAATEAALAKTTAAAAANSASKNKASKSKASKDKLPTRASGSKAKPSSSKTKTPYNPIAAVLGKTLSAQAVTATTTAIKAQGTVRNAFPSFSDTALALIAGKNYYAEARNKQAVKGKGKMKKAPLRGAASKSASQLANLLERDRTSRREEVVVVDRKGKGKAVDRGPAYEDDDSIDIPGVPWATGAFDTSHFTDAANDEAARGM